MARQAFTPPDDHDDDVLDFLASGRPAKAPAASGALGASTAAAINDAPAPRAAAPAVAPTPVAPRPRRPPAAPAAKAEQPAGLKRIGLYVDVPTWAQLKKISLERAERGEAGDFTSIVLEALRAQYPDGRWDKR